MKRYLIFALLAISAFSLAACSQAEPVPESTLDQATANPSLTLGETPPPTAAVLSSPAVTQTLADVSGQKETSIKNEITLSAGSSGTASSRSSHGGAIRSSKK
jgi:PBP1b-binding outer membrane lipoprotein LpoB